MYKHLEISAVTRKRVKGDDDSAIKEHPLFCNHSPDFEEFSIHLPLNRIKQSLSLELFDS